MRFADIAKGPSWMTVEEHRLNRRWVNRMRRMMRERCVEDTPMLMLRLEEISVMQIVCRRLENSLLKDPEAAITPALVENMAKSRERLRKALVELEEACVDNRPPAPQKDPSEALKQRYLEIKLRREREAEEQAKKAAVGEPAPGTVPPGNTNLLIGPSGRSDGNPWGQTQPLGDSGRVSPRICEVVQSRDIAPPQMLPGLARLQTAEKALAQTSG